MNERINQSRLAALLDMEPITVCRHVDRMEAAGLVERRSDPTDRRVRLLSVTEKGRELIPQMREIAQIEQAGWDLGQLITAQIQ